MFISVASAYQAAIANDCGFFSRKILPKNKKLVEVFQTQLWKKRELFSQTVNFNYHLQIFEFSKENAATACGLLMQTRCHKFIATLCILKEIFTHFAVLSKTLQHGEPSSAALLSAVSYCLAKLGKEEILATPSDDLAENGKFGLVRVQITEASTNFLSGLMKLT